MFVRSNSGQGGGNLGVNGAGSLLEAGEERAGNRIPKVVGIEKNRNFFATSNVAKKIPISSSSDNILQYLVKAQRGGNHKYGRAGKREYKVRKWDVETPLSSPCLHLTCPLLCTVYT